jgi:hypothetical protein
MKTINMAHAMPVFGVEIDLSVSMVVTASQLEHGHG